MLIVPRRRVATAAGWTPAQISSALWFDASDSSTITQSSGAVSQWNDKSGNSRNLTQATSASQPAYTSSALNGLPVLTFDGANDFLVNLSVGALGVQNAAIFSVFRLVSGGSTDDVPMAIGVDGAIGQMRGFYRSPNQTFVVFAGYDADFTSTLSYDVAGGYHVFELCNTALSGTNNAIVGKNGTLQAGTTSKTLLGAADGFTVGGLRTPGGSIGFPANISVAEIVVLYSAPSASLREQIQGYLAWKWGLQANLPAGHPYKSAAP